jgi:hypothetical protein
MAGAESRLVISTIVRARRRQPRPFGELVDGRCQAGELFPGMNPGTPVCTTVLDRIFVVMSCPPQSCRRLPLLLSLKVIGVPDPILAVLDAPLRVLIEAGYD